MHNCPKCKHPLHEVGWQSNLFRGTEVMLKHCLTPDCPAHEFTFGDPATARPIDSFELARKMAELKRIAEEHNGH